MKSLIYLFVFIGMASLVIGVAQKFFGTMILFTNISSQSHVLFANTCLLMALVLKLVND
jgi:hypothetical protein